MKNIIKLIMSIFSVCAFAWSDGGADISELKKQAEKGDANAQYELGAYYYSGNFSEDVRMWTVDVSSADQTNTYQYAVPLDSEKGFVDDVIKKGYEPHLLSGELEQEHGNKDAFEASKWFRKAAMQGDSRAQFDLGRMYFLGVGVLEDYVEAYAWFLIASMDGNEIAIKTKYLFRQELSASLATAGQRRAKELQNLIERNKSVSEHGSDQPLPVEIDPAGFGSGLLISGGYVLTCWHVVDGAERVSVSLNGKDHVASIAQKDAANDVAILKVNDADGGAALNFSEDVKLGEKVFTLGYPHPDLQGSDVKFTTGSISSLTGIDNSPRYYQISAPLQAGNSGGPLFDEHGNLVGIVAAKLDSMATLALTGDLPQNVNYAIKADYLVPLLKTVEGLEVGKEKTKDVNLLELIEELKKSAVMIKVY